MATTLTVEGMIDEVRALLDEDNRSRIEDNSDIVTALNRAQRHAVSIISKHYKEPLLAFKQLDASSSNLLPIPRDAIEGRLLKVEVRLNTHYTPVQAVSFQNATNLEYPAANVIPTHYAIIGHNYRLYPSNSATYPLRIWYLKEPLTLSKSLGQITKVGATYVVLNDATDVEVGTYVNVIDHRTGELVGQLQVKRVSGNRVEFRNTPDRSEVNQEPVTTLTSILTSTEETVETVKEDDFLCPTGTTNVPFMTSPFSNFYVAFAEAEVRRTLGEETNFQEQLKDEFQQTVESMWSGRENTSRIKNKNGAWGGIFRNMWRGTSR